MQLFYIAKDDRHGVIPTFRSPTRLSRPGELSIRIVNRRAAHLGLMSPQPSAIQHLNY